MSGGFDGSGTPLKSAYLMRARRYDGEWVDAQRSGEGRCDYSNGDVYQVGLWGIAFCILHRTHEWLMASCI